VHAFAHFIVKRKARWRLYKDVVAQEQRTGPIKGCAPDVNANSCRFGSHGIPTVLNCFAYQHFQWLGVWASELIQHAYGG
jgi:hypothetical protein